MKRTTIVSLIILILLFTLLPLDTLAATYSSEAEMGLLRLVSLRITPSAISGTDQSTCLIHHIRATRPLSPIKMTAKNHQSLMP